MEEPARDQGCLCQALPAPGQRHALCISKKVIPGEKEDFWLEAWHTLRGLPASQLWTPVFDPLCLAALNTGIPLLVPLPEAPLKGAQFRFLSLLYRELPTPSEEYRGHPGPATAQCLAAAVARCHVAGNAVAMFLSWSGHVSGPRRATIRVLHNNEGASAKKRRLL
eukprot:364662-Chlamydomonas_euryale.AAC.6